jgi:hypothetical protein
MYTRFDGDLKAHELPALTGFVDTDKCLAAVI